MKQYDVKDVKLNVCGHDIVPPSETSFEVKRKIDTKIIRDAIAAGDWDPHDYINELGYLCGAYEELLQKTRWQPIETAPKKNTIDVILYIPSEHFSGMYIANWVKDHWQARCTTWIGKDLPTHWMPLPKPPEGK